MNKEHLIKGLLGPGYTMIASKHARHRYDFTIQMAMALAQGERFLGVRETRQCRVIYVSRGKGADYEETKSRYKHQFLIIEEEWPRIGWAFTNKARVKKSDIPDLGVIFLGDYMDLKSNISEYYRDLQQTLDEMEDKESKADSLTKRNLLQQWEEDNGRVLWRLSDENRVAVVVGATLNSNNRLSYKAGLYHCDDEIYLYQGGKGKGDQFTLETKPGRYVSSDTWEMTYDREKKLFLPDVLVEGGTGKMRKAKDDITLSDKQKKILDAVWKPRFVTPGQVIKETGIRHTTVYDNMEALATPERGEWLICVSEDPLTYFPNLDKERYW